MLNLQQLRVLLAVRDHGSLTRAAAQLRYGVPSINHHLRTLEAYLEASLVERSRSGTKLTPLGESFAAEAEQILARIDRAQQAVADQRDAGVVTLRVGTFASLGSRLLPAAIARLRERTEVRVEVIEAEPNTVVRMLRDGEVQAGLIYDGTNEPAFDAPDLTHTTLLTEPYLVLVSKHGPLAARETLDFSDLDDEVLQNIAWIRSRDGNGAADRTLERIYASLGQPVRELMRTDDLYMIHGLVAEGLGCALTTPLAVDADFDVVLRPAVQDLGGRHVSFITSGSSGAPVPAAARWLGEILARVAAERAAR